MARHLLRLTRGWVRPYFRHVYKNPIQTLAISTTASLHFHFIQLQSSHTQCSLPPINPTPPPLMDPTGTIIFSTVGRTHYGFDVFSVKLPTITNPNDTVSLNMDSETCLTDGVSINFNAQFVDQNDVVFVSERTGSPRIYLSSPKHSKPEPLPSANSSLFHDRPLVKNNHLYFISAHEQPDSPFASSSALYSIDLNHPKTTRLSPPGVVDYSPSISHSGRFIAVASYGNRPWEGEFHELHTEIVVFEVSDPEKRLVVSQRGGWPTWSSDNTIFYHRQADDGWWSVYQVGFDFPVSDTAPLRVTPPGVHCFTPAAFQDGKRIAVATRRRGQCYRHVEIFDLQTRALHPVTELLNPNFHHYNPFVSPDSLFLGYHRFRGESSRGELEIPHLEPIASPVKNLRLLRLNGSFPAFSPRGDLVALNHDFDVNGGLKIVKSDGSKRWALITERTAFYNSWSPKEENVIYTSVGPIFAPARATVQIARVSFDPSHLTEDSEEVACEVKILTKEETGNNAFPSCSPDGKSLVFRSGRNGHKNLYIMDAVNGEFDGGSIRQLTEGPCIDTMPSWSPKGDLIAFSSNRHDPDNDQVFGIYLVKPDGSDLRRVSVTGPPDRERINHVCFSADGEWLLFTANFAGVTAEPVSWPNQFQPYGDLHVVRVGGSGLRRLTWNAYENGTPAWHPGVELDFGRLSLVGNRDEDRLRGQFEEPLWISCDL